MARTIALVNQKGGVGKTTTAINLAAALALKGKQTLLIDLDPQGNATAGVGVDKNTQENTIYEVLVGECDMIDALVQTPYERLMVVPSNIQLAGASVELASMEGREYRLKKALDKTKDRFDYVLIDCPPSLGLLTLNALVAVDALIIPMQCEYYALEGISQLLDAYTLIRRQLNPKLEIQGIVMTMYDVRTNLSKQVTEEVKSYFGDKVYQTLIPRNVRLSEAPSYGEPGIHYAADSKGAQAYMALAEEVIGNG